MLSYVNYSTFGNSDQNLIAFVGFIVFSAIILGVIIIIIKISNFFKGNSGDEDT